MLQRPLQASLLKPTIPERSALLAETQAQAMHGIVFAFAPPVPFVMIITSINIKDSQERGYLQPDACHDGEGKMSKTSLTPRHMREVFPRKIRSPKKREDANQTSNAGAKAQQKIR